MKNGKAAWLALMMAVPGDWSIDEDRSACESMHPAKYLKTSYYEHWLHGLESLLKKYTPDSSSPMRPEGVWPALTAHRSYARDIPTPAAFAIGQKVRVKVMNPTGPHPSPALRAGPRGRSGENPWRPCFPRFKRAWASAKIRNGFTPCASPQRNYGATPMMTR